MTLKMEIGTVDLGKTIKKYIYRYHEYRRFALEVNFT
jgi:hypothetical protein